MTLMPPARAADAMRYYRVWIYACNGALLLAALAFIAAAGRAMSDYRRALVPGLGAAQPGFLYGYAALPTQAGLLQLLGCLAALRLSEKLLNAYWLALLALLVGDAAIGVFWAFRFERVCRDLKPTLRARLVNDYASDADFAEAWNRLQREQKCCGVAGPSDFVTLNRTSWPPSCCKAPSPTLATSIVAAASATCTPYSTPCGDRLLAWVRRTADALVVLGYCVIAFLKLCFLAILRYEIKEMIQKIRILRTEVDAEEYPEEGGFLRGGGPLSQTVIVNAVNANGGVRTHGGGGGGAREGSPDRGGERDALLGRAMRDDPTTNTASSNKNINGNNNCEMKELARGDYKLLASECVENAATRI